jgi:hypothetical protein
MMINGLISFFLTAGSSPVTYDDDDRLSSVYSIESDPGSKSSCANSEDLESDRPCPIDSTSASSFPSSSTELKVPETAYALGRSASSPPALRRASMISPLPYQHQTLSRSAHSLRALPLPPIKPLSPIYEPVDLACDENDVQVATSPTGPNPSPSSLCKRIFPAGSQGEIKKTRGESGS